jgi:hypothetical protein
MDKLDIRWVGKKEQMTETLGEDEGAPEVVHEEEEVVVVVRG